VVAPGVDGVVSKNEIRANEPIFEYKASLSLLGERGAHILPSRFFGNVVYNVQYDSNANELIFADASRHSDVFSAKVRKSCRPNSELRHFVGKDHDGEETLRLFVVAREPIEQCTEITIPLDLDYRGNEINEIDCACRTEFLPNQVSNSCSWYEIESFFSPINSPINAQ
jgi:hypothetical protein